MTPIVAAMIQAMWSNRHNESIREQLRRCLQIERERRNNENSRFNEVPGRDNSRDLRLIELPQ